MRTVALDLGAKKIAYCEVKDGKVIDRATVRSFAGLTSRIGPNTAPARVLFEAGRTGWHIHAKLEEYGHEPLMLDTTRAKQIGIGQHGKKTDRLDAEVLAMALESGRVPLAHVLSPHRQEIRMQLGVRRALVETRANLVTTARGLIVAKGYQVPSCSTAGFVAKLEATSLDEATRALVTPIVPVLEQVNEQIAIAEAKLEQICAEEPVINLLKTSPGVATIVAAAFVSVIDEAGRFRNAHQVEAYLGLVPSEDSSGGRRRIGSITKHGNNYLRALLVQSAWAILKLPASDDPLKLWGEAIAKRRGKRIAVIAIARRLVGILWSMWRRDTVYDPRRLGNASARGTEQNAQELDRRARALRLAAAKGRRGRRPKTAAMSPSMS